MPEELTKPKEYVKTKSGRKKRKLTAEATSPAVTGRGEEECPPTNYIAPTIETAPLGQRRVASKEESPSTTEDDIRWLTLAKVDLYLVGALASCWRSKALTEDIGIRETI